MATDATSVTRLLNKREYQSHVDNLDIKWDVCVCVCIIYKYKYNPNLNNINNGNKMKNNLGLDDCLSTCMIYNILLKKMSSFHG